MWDENVDPFTATVRSTIKRLRRKLGEPDPVETPASAPPPPARPSPVYVTVQNLTDHQSFAKIIRFAAPDASSAEWIAEAPSQCAGDHCQPLPLTNFHTIRFSNATATTGAGHIATITDPAFTTFQMTLVSSAPLLGPRLTSSRRSRHNLSTPTIPALSPRSIPKPTTRRRRRLRRQIRRWQPVSLAWPTRERRSFA